MTIIDITATPMPMGKYKGQPVNTLSTPFLCWWISQDAIRVRHQPTAKAILATMRDRLNDMARIEQELLLAVPADGSDLV